MILYAYPDATGDNSIQLQRLTVHDLQPLLRVMQT
jgi:hypothetical protein